VIGWQNYVVERPDGCKELHCVPEQDIADHLLMSGMCRCCPAEDPVHPDMWSHSSFDGREAYERGRRLH